MRQPTTPDSQVFKVELRFSARNLLNKDLFSLSDPFLVCHTVRHGIPHREIGRTETVQDDLNPVWATTFSFDYDAPTHSGSLLVLDLFDQDSKDGNSLSKHDFLGRAFLSLAHLINAPHMRLDLDLLPVPRGNPYPKRKKRRPSSSNSSSVSASGSLDLQPQHHHHHLLHNDDGPPSNVTMFSHMSELTSDIPSEANTPFATNHFDPSSPSSSTLRHSRLNNTASAFQYMPSMRPSKASMELGRATRGSRAGKVRGSVTVMAEFLAPNTGVDVIFNVQSTMLRDPSSFSATLVGRNVTQFYEIQRERREGSKTEWLCVYRSPDGVRVDRNNYVTFDEVSVEERILHNMSPDRALRVAFFKRNVRVPHELISYVTLHMDELMEPRFRNNDVALEMEGLYGDDDGLGHVMVRRVERWVSEPHVTVEQLNHSPSPTHGDLEIHLRADHFLNSNFISSLNDAPRHARRLRQLPSFLTLH